MEEFLRNIEVIDDIKPKQGCYFLYDGDEIVYIGLSNNIDKRVQQHTRTKHFDLVKYIPVDNYIYANLVESYYIDLLEPKYNKKPGLYGQQAKIRNYDIQEDGWNGIRNLNENYDEYQIPSLNQQIENRVISGVFMLINNGTPFYIGTACNIKAHLYSMGISKYRKLIDEVWIIEENDYLTALKIEDALVPYFKPVRTSFSKIERFKASFGERFNEKTIPYPGGWVK